MFSDDILVYLFGKDSGRLIDILNQERSVIAKWMTAIKLKLNCVKTKFMFLDKESLYLRSYLRTFILHNHSH